MKCECLKTEGRSYRQTFQQATHKKAHMAVKVASSLGLKEYILNKFVFRCKRSKYKIEANKLLDFSDFPIQFDFPKHTLHTQILTETTSNLKISVPMAFLKHKDPAASINLVYSHGNSSDLVDSLKFFQYLLKKSQKEKIKMNVVLYDYTGYGCSSETTISEETMVEDLRTVLKWLKAPQSSIVLWGFSLGSFPTVQVAAKQKLGGIILHSPLASGATFFEQNQAALKDDSHLPYDVDCLSNVEAITQIRCPILMMHSSADEIIPFSHSLKLYQCVKQANKNSNFSLVEMDQLQHNQIHSFLLDMNSNSVNVFMWGFLGRIGQLSQKLQHIWSTDQPTEEEGENLGLGLENKPSNNHSGYFQMS